MAVALDSVVKQLTDSGIVAPGKLENFVPPKASPKDGEELLRELYKQNLLTKFQAQQVAAGKGRALILGNYLVLDKIGAGGMGQVFKAEHRRMERIVAIKMLPSAMTKDAAAVARFHREAKAAAKLTHSNIVVAYDADEANGVHFLVMEYVEGQDLSALVKRNGPFSVPKAVNYILQAARGLEFAHGEGVVHRDIKPANLLLDKKGTVKILDMGLARIESAGNAATEAELTGSGAVMGTIDYMAPEQALNTKTADARADIYSLGCSLFYLLTGKATFDGDTLTAKLLAHQNHPIPALRAIRPEVPEEVEAIFRKMLAKKIEDRYQSISEVIADLEQCGLRQEQSINTQQSLGTSADVGSTGSFKVASQATTKLAPVTKVTKPQGYKSQKKLLLIGSGILGLLLLFAGLVVKLRTKEGTLIVTVNEPDAQVEVWNEEGKIEITRKGEKGPITISIDPGKHQLRVQKDGFILVTKEFEIESGGEKTIAAKLVPVDEKPVATGPKPVPIPVVRTPLAFETPGFDQWVAEVTAMPADQQIEAVGKKLVDLNPGFDGILMGFDGEATPPIENGVVTGLRFLTDNITDLSPLQALIGLKFLWCNGSGHNVSTLADLSPLRGMKLTTLHCHYCELSDLSPLQGMPLSVLWVSGTQVTDLSPLRGMPLTELKCDRTPVADLSPLRNMKLTSLMCYQTHVSDISSLRGMPLTELGCSSTQVSDWSPLCGMPLELLSLASTTMSDLSLLEGMPLMRLTLDHTPVANLSPLKSMPLEYLRCQDTNVSDFLPLKELPLVYLNLDFKPFRDTEIIRSIKTLETINDKKAADFWKEVEGQKAAFDKWTKDVAAMPADQQVEAVSKKLVELNHSFDGIVTGAHGSPKPTIENNVVTELAFSTDDVTDISPVNALRGLQVLICDGSKADKGDTGSTGLLNDLSPLKGLPLWYLSISNTRVSDLMPLKGMPLRQLSISGTQVSDLSPLRDLPLTDLYCYGTQVSDLSPLHNVPLKFLNCGGTTVNDLSPLQDLQLTQLHCVNSQVADLSPLRGMPLTGLLCPGTLVSDLSPIKDTPLKQLFCDFKPFRDTAVLHNIKTLESINGKPAAAFWKEVESQQRQFEEWTKDVAAMPVERQIEAVRRKLIDLNPGFDGMITGFGGRLTPTIDNGVVTDIAFVSDNVKDISPIRALSGLKMLACNGSKNGQGKVADLSPLQGVPLTQLQFACTMVADLTPLTEMSLVGLDCSRTPVSDLSPLAGMPLKTLACWSTRVSDLSPLEGMSLDWLSCNLTEVSDLSPLKGSILTQLHFESTPVSDLSPLKGMSLLTLSCNSTAVTDLSPLKGMQLRFLNCAGSKVSDLSPLEGMPIAELYCHRTAVEDLSALTGMPLVILNCEGNRIVDFSPLETLPLKSLHFTFTTIRETELLRSIKTLETINGKPVAEFWKEVEEQQATFQQWMKDVQAMPAEQQVEAVSNKLVELNPEFDGKVTPTIMEGSVTGLHFAIEKVTDISPVRALPELKILFQPGLFGNKSQLSDLSPLKGMSLTSLTCPYSEVSDLTPLKGMKLEILEIIGSRVADLSVLKGMPLEGLNCNFTPVSDLTPLGEMPLKALSIWGTNVSDLTPLAGLPLNGLSLSNTNVSDLSVLKGMPLETLYCNNTKVSNYSSLERLPLRILSLDFNPFRDNDLLRSIKTLESINNKPVAEFWKEVEEKQVAFQQWMKDVQAMPAEQQVEAVSKKLVELNPGFDGKVTDYIRNGTPEIEDGVVKGIGFLTTNVSDISPVRALKDLRKLNCGGTSDKELGVLSDLSPLKGMQLEVLLCFYTHVADLTPLQEMPLATFNCHTTQVIDLSPLQAIPLTELRIAKTLASDYSPLSDMPLKALTLDFKPERDTELLRSIKTLETINDKPAAEFWKEVEEQKGK
ncbi:MAG: protein kinase [Pirellulales bacterium]